MSTMCENRLKSETELITEARAGSREAMGELVRRHHADVRGFLARFLFDQSVVDDVAQEVFMGATLGIQSLENSQSIRGWLLSMAKFKAIDYLRKNSRSQTSSAEKIEALIADHQLGRLESVDESMHDQRETLEAMNACIKQLTPASRNLVILFYFKQQAAETIAAQMQRRPGTVRMTLLRIRKILAKCIKLRMGPDFGSEHF